MRWRGPLKEKGWRRRGWLIALLGLGLSLGIAALASAWGATVKGSANGGSIARANPYDEFPLWSGVPGRTFAILKEGKLPNGTRWGVYASRVGDGVPGFEHPCLTVAKISRVGAYGHVYECGRPTPQDGEPPVYPHINATFQEDAKGPVRGEAVMAFSVEVDVTRVRATASTGATMSWPTRQISSRQRAKARLPSFRYVAVALSKDVCVASLAGYKSDGKLAFERPTEACAS